MRFTAGVPCAEFFLGAPAPRKDLRYGKTHQTRPRRRVACILALLVIVFVVALYKLQIVDGKAYYEENRNSVASSQTVEAARQHPRPLRPRARVEHELQ